MRFEPGVVVQLKSGGPAMTVISMDADGVHCIWYAEANDEVRTSVIPAVALDAIEIAVIDDEDE